MPIQEFNPVFRPVINPIDLDKLGQAYDTLEQGHLKAIDTASAVEAELAKLDLNEAEDEWRQQQVNKIRSAVTNNSTYGNAYGALDDVIRENGSVIENRIDESYFTLEMCKRENKFYLNGCLKYDLRYFLIDEKYPDLNQLL